MIESQQWQDFEKNFFKTLNSYLEPWLRVGVGSPGVVPVGTIVLETTGRKSGRLYKTPLLTTEFIDVLVVSTARDRSQWMKNLAASPQTHIWLRGRRRPVTAYVIDPELDSAESLPEPSPRTQIILKQVRRLSQFSKNSFVVLEAHDEAVQETAETESIQQMA